jgi:tRNA(fMet)-specific endonuclease VapC
MYLLDTDVLSNLLRRAPSPALIARIAATPPAEQATSSISYGELAYGARRLGPRGEELLRRIEDDLILSLEILPFDAAAAIQYGGVRAALEAAGTPIGDADLRIAAIALSRELTVVSGNVRHFERVPGLVVENWLG